MKNQGHQAWKGLVPLKDPTGALLREQLCYVDGYMLMADDQAVQVRRLDRQRAARQPQQLDATQIGFYRGFEGAEQLGQLEHAKACQRVLHAE